MKVYKQMEAFKSEYIKNVICKVVATDKLSGAPSPALHKMLTKGLLSRPTLRTIKEDDEYIGIITYDWLLEDAQVVRFEYIYMYDTIDQVRDNTLGQVCWLAGRRVHNLYIPRLESWEELKDYPVYAALAILLWNMEHPDEICDAYEGHYLETDTYFLIADDVGSASGLDSPPYTSAEYNNVICGL